MKALPVEFKRAKSWPPWTVALGLLLLAVLACVSCALAWRAWQARAGLQADLQQLRQAQQQREAVLRVTASQPRATASRLPPHAADALRHSRVASFNAAAVLAAAESSRVPGVKLAGIDIDAEQRQVRFDLELADQRLLGPYLDALNAGECMARWQVLRLDASPAPGGQATAVLQAKWATHEQPRCDRNLLPLSTSDLPKTPPTQ